MPLCLVIWIQSLNKFYYIKVTTNKAAATVGTSKHGTLGALKTLKHYLFIFWLKYLHNKVQNYNKTQFKDSCDCGTKKTI